MAFAWWGCHVPGSLTIKDLHLSNEPFCMS